MADGGERRRYVRHRRALQGRAAERLRPLNHDDRQAKPSRRFDLAVTGAATGILGNHRLDAVVLQHADFVIQCKGAARGDVARIRYFQRRLHGVDAADEIIVPRGGFEGEKLLAAESQKYTPAFISEHVNGLFDGFDALPPVTRLLLPGGARKRDERNVSQPCRFNRVDGNSRRIGMGGIDQNIEALGADEIRQPRRAAKTATAHWYWLFDRRERAARHGQQNSVAGVLCQPAGQNAGIRRTAKDEYGACHDV